MSNTVRPPVNRRLDDTYHLRGGKILMDPIHKAVLGEVITVENLFIKDPADKIIAMCYYSDSISSRLVVYTEKTEVEQ